MILEVQIQNFGAPARQSFHFQKIPGGLNINIFLKTMNTQMLFCSVFLKTHKKKLLTAKNAILAIFEN